MRISLKDEQILEHIIRYCNQAAETIKYFSGIGISFHDNFIYQDAVSMELLQIGELSKHLSDELKKNTSSIPWKAISGMRNRFAHDYQSMDYDAIINTAINDLPLLKRQCQAILQSEHEHGETDFHNANCD